MKRPEGFDERPAQRAAADEGEDRAPRERRVPRLGRLTGRRGAPDAQEAPLAPAPSAEDRGTVASTPARPAGALPDLPDVTATGTVIDADDDRDARRDHDQDRDGRHDADRDHADRDHADRDHLDGDRAPGATDVVDLRTASRPDHTDSTPIGAGVRAAETAREARAARKRRRLHERAEVRRFTRRSRHRRVAWLTTGGIVVVLGVSILVAVFSPLMALQRIEVKGTSRVDDAALRRALSDQIGTPLARLDSAAIKRDIAAFPLIESYVTEESPPHTLVVTVTERTPVVTVQNGKSFDLVDPAGIVVQSTTKRPDTMPLADVGSAKLGSSVFRTMTEVVLALPSAVRSQVSGVAASTSDDVTLTMKDGSRVVWGSPDESTAKAALLDALVKDHAARAPDTAVEYDVSAPDNGIIRTQD
ncbi:FtsQ-type POTRA domain-containing protein [Curtobacterium sp. VKM Ac-2865]|uniref:FtsQ-type POTRA domain-containing protein n=1 Tax=Curtobacterium sp. VKM Ac-2865 TaxID=2783817 RepID=UPI001889F247|nr:FtsQ-type POTRA domain-containing protein [Curtobacterium sp. VKM Ac-2865]MBF4581888.1 FtsQ-type POTRA domain-containing protein [Curtobacterium sp. VKM Ac-2865]